MVVNMKPESLYRTELMSGILLIISFLTAMALANSEASQAIYKNFVFYPVTFGSGHFLYQGPLIQLVNDGLMTFFFLLIGLELKFYLIRGEFRNKKTLILPGAAAIGGIIFPAFIYWVFNAHSKNTLAGWAIPIATDTAFMLGILSFFGKFISSHLRAFIIGFSLIDDAIALIILAVFYSKSASLVASITSLILTGLLIVLNRLKVASSFCYLFIGVFLWVAMVESGIHGTLCGVVLALVIPLEHNNQLNPSFHRLEKTLRPLVYFWILPLFAFINSGVSFSDFSLDLLTQPLALGVILGLLMGKQFGIFLFSYIAVKLNYCSLPANIGWSKLYAISVLGGIGFTLSLFIGEMTFEASYLNYVMRTSVIIGSLLSAMLGIVILSFLRNKES